MRIMVIDNDELIKVPPEKLISLDTEGGPSTITELAIVDGNETVLFSDRNDKSIMDDHSIVQIMRLMLYWDTISMPT